MSTRRQSEIAAAPLAPSVSAVKQWRNYIWVTVVTADGKRKALCASPRQDLMQSFMTDLAARVGVKAEDAASGARDAE
jgi:hypothetical protein